MASGAIKKARAAHKRERKELAKQKKQAKDEKRAREYEERKRCASPPPNTCLTPHILDVDASRLAASVSRSSDRLTSG